MNAQKLPPSVRAAHVTQVHAHFRALDEALEYSLLRTSVRTTSSVGPALDAQAAQQRDETAG
jgi:hypothetical protein